MKDKIKKNLKELVSKKRYQHIMGVVETSKKLAKKYGYDEEKCELAALLHDYCKKNEDIFIQKYLDEYERLRQVLGDLIDQRFFKHAALAAIVAKNEYGIVDEEILEAIIYHPIAKAGLGPIGKILYLADKSEPGREFPEAEDFRKQYDKGLDAALYYTVKTITLYELESDSVIPTFTMDYLNEYNRGRE